MKPASSVRLPSWVLACAMVAAVSVTAVLVVGCSSRRAAKFADPALFEATTTREIVLMPVVDQRENRLDSFDVGALIRTAVDRVLGKKGYTVLTSRHLEGAERPPFEGLSTLSDQELSDLGPDGSRLLLYVAVDKVTYVYDRFGDAYGVYVSGVLVDRSLSRVIWRDQSSGDTNFGGFLALLAPDSRYDAVYEAVDHLFSSLPDYNEGETKDETDDEVGRPPARPRSRPHS